MASILKTYDFESFNRGDRTVSPKYPWGEWFDGQIRRITQGTDYSQTPETMERMIRTRASNYGIKVKIRTERDRNALVIQSDQNLMDINPKAALASSLKLQKAAAREAALAAAAEAEAEAEEAPKAKKAPAKKAPAKKAPAKKAKLTAAPAVPAKRVVRRKAAA